MNNNVLKLEHTNPTKLLKAAPLPFRGQKRMWYVEFRKAILEAPNNSIFIDVFGGSGILSHWIKQLRPSNRVIYNDFDNYSKRIEVIPQTNVILHDIRRLVATRYIKKAQKIDKETQKDICKILENAEKLYSYVDYITLSSSLMFSGSYGTCLKDFTKCRSLWNCIKQTDYSIDRGYLDGLEIVSKDYRDLMGDFSLKHNTVFLLDPPYLQTQMDGYNIQDKWGIKEHLQTLKVLNNCSFFYFTSDKSDVPELTQFISEFALTYTDPLSIENGTKKVIRNYTLNYSSEYKDVMYYKYK